MRLAEFFTGEEPSPSFRVAQRDDGGFHGRSGLLPRACRALPKDCERLLRSARQKSLAEACGRLADISRTARSVADSSKRQSPSDRRPKQGSRRTAGQPIRLNFPSAVKQPQRRGEASALHGRTGRRAMVRSAPSSKHAASPLRIAARTAGALPTISSPARFHVRLQISLSGHARIPGRYGRHQELLLRLRLGGPIFGRRRQ